MEYHISYVFEKFTVDVSECSQYTGIFVYFRYYNSNSSGLSNPFDSNKWFNLGGK